MIVEVPQVGRCVCLLLCVYARVCVCLLLQEYKASQKTQIPCSACKPVRSRGHNRCADAVENCIRISYKCKLYDQIVCV